MFFFNIMQRTHSLPIYKLTGQVIAPCSSHGHWRLRVTSDETRKKLDEISEMLEGKMTTTGLVVPDDLAKKYDYERKPYSADEFVVKVSQKQLNLLPEEYIFVKVYVQVRTYKFEKEDKKYTGWNLILKKVEQTA